MDPVIINQKRTQLVKARNVKDLAKSKFGFDLSPGQEDIVRNIAFRIYNRQSISAMTRYGKTLCVAIGVALMILLNRNLKIAFLGPKQEQAGLLRQYMSDLILMDPELLGMAQIYVKGVEKIQKEASRKRMTFTNGCEYRVFSTEGEADRLMGFGADIVIKDEACLINRVANAKIMRMLGDNPDNSMLVELYNPWDRDNVAFEHTLDPRFHCTHIGWRQAVEEGRTTQAFVDEQRKELTPLEFEVLYESRFPKQSEDSLFNEEHITAAENRLFGFESKLAKIERILELSHKHTEKEVAEAKSDLAKYVKIISCDPADKGLDETVIYWGISYENKYELIGYFSEPKSESTQIVGRIIDKCKNWIGKKVRGKIFIDRIGIGAGPLSFLKQELSIANVRNVVALGSHYGEAAIKKDLFINKKAENFFRCRDIFAEGMISIPKIPKLKHQLMMMKWEITSSAKKKIIDPDKSPDYADALTYFVWYDHSSLNFGFL